MRKPLRGSGIGRLAALLALMLTLVAGVRAQEVSSPNGSIKVALSLEEGKLSYSVTLDDMTMLEPSPLGLETSIGSFASGLELVGTKTASVEDHYTLPHGKVSEVHYQANELTATLRNSNGHTLDVVFRVSDRDVAFRYRVTAGDLRRIVIQSEASGFNFPEGTTAYLTHQVPWGEGFAKSKPSYEEGYMMNVPVGTRSPRGLGFTFPALFRYGNDGWALVSETGVSGKYCGSRLSDPTEDGIYTIAFPDPRENAGRGEVEPAGSLPFETPWRTITVGRTLAPIVETTVATDLVEPLYEPTTDYKPGRATWSWILWQDNSMNERDQRAFIDLAADLDFEYILIDAWWDERVGREKMAELVKYAESKGVGVLLWYNSNGYWNDAPQSPRDKMDSAPIRQNEMAWLQSIGVKGLKVDFFGGDKQETIKLYEDILTDANRYGLNINFHGATLPRGWERMYPNHMTSEAALASENLVFSQGFANGEAHTSTIYPFVRNTVAAMDYGPVFLNPRFSRDANRGTRRITTDAFQLATAVTYQSGIQHFGVVPNNLDEQPDYVIDFLKKVPAAWDETRYVAGLPGEYVVLARRSGDTWYVAATHADNENGRELTIELPWLSGRTAKLYHDQEDRKVGLKEVTIGADGRVTLALGVGGGAILVAE